MRSCGIARQLFEIECVGERAHAEEHRTLMVAKIIGPRSAFQYRHHAGNSGPSGDADKAAIFLRAEHRAAQWAEDLDLCLRIKSHGWKIFYCPAVRLVHHKGRATRKSSSRMIGEFYRSSDMVPAVASRPC